MPTDFEWSSDRGIHFDGTGDFGTVSDEDNAIQQIVLDVYDEQVGLRSDALTATRIEEFKADVRDRLANNDYVDTIVDMTVTDVTEDSLSMEISTLSDDLSVDVPRT